MSKTSPLLKFHNRCDACGDSILRAHRVYNNEAFCDTCYPVWFKNKLCVRCGEIHRAYHSEKQPICLECKRKEPCIRCGKDAYNNGTNTQYGRVCQSCNQYYFKPKKTCFECGKEHHNVSRSKHANHSQAICDNCAKRYTHKTCPCCHRYRPMVQTDKGEMCQKCHDLGQIECEQCHNLMWAGVGKRCWDCYWSDKLAHETKLNQYIFRNESIKTSYADFVVWFANTRGGLKANLKHNDFVEFFARCDELWGEIPDYDLLVTEFKPEGLRHNLTVLRWLVDTKQIMVNEQLKEQMAEEERIRNLFAKFEHDAPSIVQKYHAYLIQRQQERQTALKTIRLNLQPVVDIYHQFNLKSENTPSQEQIDKYLSVKGGQKNSLNAFIVFLREKYDIKLDIRPLEKRGVVNIGQKTLQNQIITMTKLPKPLSKDNQALWLQLGMMYFHKQPLNLNVIKKIEVSDDEVNNMFILHYKNQAYAIPRI